MAKKLNVPKALIFGALAFVMMTLFWRFLGDLIGTQTGYLAWAWNVVRKIVTLGFTAIAFLGGLKCE